MNAFQIKVGLYLFAALLFLVAFSLWEGSMLRWVYFFCAITFGSIGVGYVLKARRQKKD